MRSLLFLLTILVACNSNKNTTMQQTVADTTAAKSSFYIESETDALNKKADTILSKANQKFAAEKLNEEFLQRAIVSKRDSSFNIYQNIRADYRIFGYKTPDTNAKKLLLFSVFTNDVEGNPHKCSFGSYYYTGAMENMELKYRKKVGSFVEAVLLKDKVVISPVFFHQKWVEFDD